MGIIIKVKQTTSPACSIYPSRPSVHYLSQLFPWRPNPSGKVLKTVRENFFWQVPSGMARQGWTDRESPPSLTENHHGMVPDGYCRQERVFPSTFLFPSGESFPVGYHTVRKGSNLPCQLQYRLGRLKLTLPAISRQGRIKPSASQPPSGKSQF